MKLHAIRPPNYHAGPNMTPLVDVVMVVLVFLMLAGSFGSAEHFLAAQMADRGGAPLPAAPPGDLEVLDVMLSPGRGDTFVAHAGDIRTGDAETLSARLADKRALYAAHGTPADDIRVVIRPTADVRYDHVAAAYDAALRAGYTRVAFATSR